MGRADLRRPLAIIAIAAAAGALIAIGIVQVRGARYGATIAVRAPTADATCIYFTCQQPVPSSQGNPYVLDQANSISSQLLASRVHSRLSGFGGTTADLAANVSAKPIGGSPTIRITYTDRNRAVASRIATAYANAYIDWSNSQAITSLTALRSSLAGIFAGFTTTRQRNGPRAVEISNAIAEVDTAIEAFRQKDGPNGAKFYDSSTVTVAAVRTTPSALKAAVIGASAGIVLAIGLMLVIPALTRSRRADEQPADVLDRLDHAAGREPGNPVR